MNLEEAYQRVTNDPSDIIEHLPTFEAAVYELNAQKVIELGVRNGVSTVAFLHALQYTGGELWSVDIKPPRGSFLPQPGWHFVEGDSIDREILARLPAQADVILVDSSHEYLQTFQELRHYWPRLAEGGRMFLHDTEVETPDPFRPAPAYPVKKAACEFALEQHLRFENQPNCYGLGTLISGSLDG